jgi:hypothetical protein
MNKLLAEIAQEVKDGHQLTRSKLLDPSCLQKALKENKNIPHCDHIQYLIYY